VNSPRPDLLTADELADALRVSRRTVDRMVADGLPRVQVRPRLFRYDLNRVIQWCASTPAATESMEMVH
jgi:excisionase family DNA binding protein